MQTDKSTTLSDGRTLSYAEYGLPDGFPVFFFHGIPSSRMEPMLLGDETFCRYGLRIIAPDRPGMGNSTFQPKRAFSHWAVDMIELANHLGVDRFSVIGNSGGCPYAAVCAAKIPERLVSAAVTSGAWHMDWPEASVNLPFPNGLIWTLAKRAPFLLGPMIGMMSSSSGKEPSEKDLEKMKQKVPAADYEAMMRPEIKEKFMQMSKESMRQGTKGVVWDARMMVTPWDFELSEVRMPLFMFHGGKDATVPTALARKAASLLPDARLVVYEEEAHASTPINRFEDIVRELKR